MFKKRPNEILVKGEVGINLDTFEELHGKLTERDQREIFELIVLEEAAKLSNSLVIKALGEWDRIHGA